ncbi:MAG: hypothetical protein Q8J84_08770 [Flavobacteriaceae bacterium]|nr:hypothetical protein [Flavobacteriaceae bacterium]
MTTEAAAKIGATVVVVIFYMIFKGIFSKAKELTSKTSHIQESQVMSKLDVRNKQSIIDGIDHCTDIGEYDEALKLCNIYYEYNEYDEEIDKRIKYLKKIK